MDKQEQTDQDRFRGVGRVGRVGAGWGRHVLFAKSCSPCPLPVWPLITAQLGRSADCRWPCVDPDNLQSNHRMAAPASDPQAAAAPLTPSVTREPLKKENPPPGRDALLSAGGKVLTSASTLPSRVVCANT